MASCTLYAILARDGRSAVVSPRGPSKSVLLLRWWLASNRVEEGQWLRGRIYEDRCDLSFDGEYLLYFAAKQGRGFGTWTAISRPPYLTALALWPLGDTWEGGGIFLGPRQVALAHRGTKSALAPGFALPRDWRVEQMRWPVLAEPPQGREAYIGSPVECTRLLREGWTVHPGTSHRQSERQEAESGVGYKLDPPLTFQRRQPGRTDILLSAITEGLFVRNGPSLRHRVMVSDTAGRSLRRFDHTDWADFAPNGDLLLGDRGCLYRLSARQAGVAADDPLADATLVADLRPLVFRHRRAPVTATRW